MTLPKYDKSKRRKSTPQLPKDAYVLVIKNAKEEPNRSGKGTHLTIAFDIAEGLYKDFYAKQFQANTNEDKKWPRDAIYYVTVPDDDSSPFLWDNWNTFFADLEDSNNGFVFGTDPAELKGKLIGGKFYIEQTDFNGTIYDHTRLKWTCVASDVRNGTAGKLPNDKLLNSTLATNAPIPGAGPDFLIPDNIDDEVPF